MKKKITLIVIAVLLVISLVVGISYAYWKTTYQATNINKIVSSCFSMEITNEKNNIILDDAYPITDEKGKALTPYSFTITNTCDLFASYTINLEMLEGTTLNSKYIKTMINSEAITNLSTLEATDPSIEGAIESRILFRGSLGSGDSIDYTFRVWMDYDTPNNEESMNKSFQGKITVTAEVSTYSPVENGFTNLAEALLVNEYQTTNVDIAKNKISSKQEVDFSKTAPVIEWKELYGTNVRVTEVRKADSSMIGSYGVTENATKIGFATSFTFDSSLGVYNLGDLTYYDPEELDFSKQDYYYCVSNISLSSSNVVTTTDSLGCNELKKVIGLNSVTDSEVKFSSGDSLPIKIYSFKTYFYSEVESESDKSDKGLYQAQDDYGTSYYYRGNVTNNYVKFGGLYWKVVRINGDGSIRLLYLGHSTNPGPVDTIIGTSTFNNTYNNPTYGGYMYSNNLNISYEDTIRNDNDSVAKTMVDQWYKTNILDKGYSSYIADSGFCNDRSLSTLTPNTGVNASQNTQFGAKYRVDNFAPILTCPNKSNDLFTLVGNDFGNEALIYPVGMLTIDEAMFAGLRKNYLNTLSYIVGRYNYWTISPDYYLPYYSTQRSILVGATGTINSVASAHGGAVRPVINLKSDTEITGGIGTANDPFIVK